MTESSEWPGPWVRAALDLAVLSSLRSGPLHGYALAQVLAMRGFGRLRGGSLYPALARLQEAGHVQATWVEGASGPGRKDYELTDSGRGHLREGLAAWDGLSRALHDEKEGTPWTGTASHSRQS